MPSTPNEPLRRSCSLAKILLGISGLGVLPLPLYWMIDYFASEPIRAQLKNSLTKTSCFMRQSWVRVCSFS